MGKVSGFVAALCAGVCGLGMAMEGKLARHIEKKAGDQTCNLNFGGVNAGKLLGDFNKHIIAKIGIDPKLAKTSFQSINFSGRNLPQALDMLADKVKGKSYAIRNFYYIGNATLPPGIKVGAGDGKDASEPGRLATLPVIFPGVKPGQYGSLPFIKQTPRECREELQPVLLYVIDGAAADATKAVHFETFVLEDPKVKAGCKDFSCVRIYTNNKDWPAFYSVAAKKGFALHLMTCDLQIKATIATNHYKTPVPYMLNALKGTANANKGVAERMKKVIEKEKAKEIKNVKKPPQVVAVPKDPDGKPQRRKTGISALDKKKDEKPKEKKPERKKVIEEEE